MTFQKIPQKYQRQAEEMFWLHETYLYKFTPRKWYNPMRFMLGDFKFLPIYKKFKGAK